MKRVPQPELDYPGRDGRYHHGGSPFTGVVYTLFPTGELSAEEEYRDGLPEGRHLWTFAASGACRPTTTRPSGRCAGIVLQPDGPT
jgi:hypothetical protein